MLKNTTHAIIEDDVDLYSGRESGLNVKAEELILNLSFTQAARHLNRSAAAVTAAVLGGAHIVRVHRVREMVQVVRVAEAIRTAAT